MSIVDKINKIIINNIRRNNPPTPVVNLEGILFYPKKEIELFLNFSSLQSATIYRQDGYSHDHIALTLSFPNKITLEFLEDDPQWETLCEALDHSGKTIVPSKVWRMETIADGTIGKPRELVRK